MCRRVVGSTTKGNLPESLSGETSPPEPAEDEARQREKSLLTGRAAGIFGASLVVALCAAGLTYLSVGGHTVAPAVASAAIAAVVAFAACVGFLNSIIA